MIDDFGRQKLNRKGDTNSMNRRFRFCVWLVFSALTILSSASLGAETEDLIVSKVQVETNNHLLISAETERTRIRIGDRIVLSLSVVNNGKRSIFFVGQDTPVIVNDKGDILISAPFPFPEDKEEYDYSFREIKPGESFSSRIVIPSNLITREDELDIRIGLSFVQDVTDINRRLQPGEDPMRLRGLLGKRIRTVGLGVLRIVVVR